jgi:hypothetical protein
MDGRRGTSNRWGDLNDRYSIADHPEHCLVPLLHDAQLQQHARECHDQAEPASRIGRSRVTPHPEPKCHASGGTKHVCASPTSRAPRFLPGACRHGSAPFRAFVWVEGGPSTLGRGERPASGPPTVFGPRHRKRVRWLAKGSLRQAREQAEAGTEPRAERREACRSRARQSKARSETQGDRRMAKTRAARVTRRGSD